MQSKVLRKGRGTTASVCYEDDDDEIPIKTKPITKRVTKSKKNSAIKSVFDLKPIEQPIVENYLDCTSELVEEEYV